MSVAAINPFDEVSIFDLVERNALDRPEASFVIDPVAGHAISFAQSREHIRSVAANLAARGIKPGDPVAYAFSNSAEGALVILGILYGGYLATAINLVAGESTISHVLEHSEAKLVIADDGGKALIEQALANSTTRPAIVSLTDLNTHTGSAYFQSTGSDSDIDGLLMYTSGTTGRPKGVVLTQNSLVEGGRNAATAHQITPEDCGLCVLPFYHINAFCVSLMGSLVSGSALVVPPKFSVRTFWETIRTHDCSWFSVVPTQISYLLHNAGNGGDATGCERLRFGRSASAPLSPEVHEAFEKRFGVPVIETMGLTETAAQILSNPLPPGTRKIGSPGVAFGNEVIIGDQNQREVPRGEEGEILVRGPNVLRCYLKNDEATAEAISPEGWLRTGDLGRMDEDGYVFVTGRLKELIIKGGENIAPREVDEALYNHPDVVEAAAFAVPCPNYGQRVEAGVKLCEGSKATREELLELCQKKIGPFKAPDQVHILDELPKGPSGKIQRIKLAEMQSSDNAA